MTALLVAEDLVYEYPGFRALDGVSFGLGTGTITALVGPNGAGKTTLLRCLAALDSPLAGRIAVGGESVADDPRAHRLRTGYLPDSFGVYDELTVRRCLTYAARARRLPAGEVAARVEAVAARVAIADRLGARAGTLSRGLRQRLAIAQAILHRPLLLLLDEPASGLDPEARGELASMLRELASGGMTIVVSSHILAELEDYSTHMLVLDRGRLIDHATLGDTALAGAGRRLRIRLATPVPDLATILAREPGVGAATIEGDGAVFDFAGDAAAQAGLLRTLVVAGLAVTAMAEETKGLQETYVDRLRAARGAT